MITGNSKLILAGGILGLVFLIIFGLFLYDIADDGQPLTYTFNISSQNTFGFVFISAVTMGGMMTAIIFVYVYWSKRRSKSKQ